MGVERVDYYSDDEYQQALQHEQRMQEHDDQQPDQIDMMTEEELRSELRQALLTIDAQRMGEFICSKCGLRQQPPSDSDEIHF
jgi:hypothetical protein